MTKAIIVDIDGTIADCNHRLHHIKTEPKRWDKFWIGMDKDSAIDHVIDLVRSMHAFRAVNGGEHIEIIVVTARDTGVQRETQLWLQANFVPHDQLRMRGKNDFRKDAIVKKEILDSIRADGFNVLFALEDRTHNVEMFRANGVPCLQVAPDEDAPSERNWGGKTVCSLLVGPSGCGKSTYVAKYFNPSEVVSSDEIREALTVWDRADSEATWGKLTDRDHASVWFALHDLVATRARNGLRTIVDATNIHRRDRMAILKHIPASQTVEYILLDRPLHEKLQTRGWRSEELVKKHHDTFQAGIKHALKGDDQHNVVVVDKRYK